MSANHTAAQAKLRAKMKLLAKKHGWKACDMRPSLAFRLHHLSHRRYVGDRRPAA